MTGPTKEINEKTTANRLRGERGQLKQGNTYAARVGPELALRSKIRFALEKNPDVMFRVRMGFSFRNGEITAQDPRMRQDERGSR